MQITPDIIHDMIYFSSIYLSTWHPVNVIHLSEDLAKKLSVVALQFSKASFYIQVVIIELILEKSIKLCVH